MNATLSTAAGDQFRALESGAIRHSVSGTRGSLKYYGRVMEHRSPSPSRGLSREEVFKGREGAPFSAPSLERVGCEQVGSATVASLEMAQGPVATGMSPGPLQGSGLRSEKSLTVQGERFFVM